MASRKATLAQWLRDAHASKQSRIQNLERQIERTEGAPELVTKLREHAEYSRTQAQQLEQCLSRLGTETSAVKEGASRIASMVQGWTTAFAADELVKNCIANEAYAEFEAASFASLAVAAEECGEAEIATMCGRMRDEERATAEWFQSYVPTVTRQYLAQQA